MYGKPGNTSPADSAGRVAKGSNRANEDIMPVKSDLPSRNPGSVLNWGFRLQTHRRPKCDHLVCCDYRSFAVFANRSNANSQWMPLSLRENTISQLPLPSNDFRHYRLSAEIPCPLLTAIVMPDIIRDSNGHQRTLRTLPKSPNPFRLLALHECRYISVWRKISCSPLVRPRRFAYRSPSGTRSD
jgi:hypothetical protein